MSTYGGSAECELDVIGGSLGAPSLSNKALPTNIVVEHVHGMVDGLLLEHFRLPRLQVGRNARQDLLPVLMAACQHDFQILQSAVDLSRQVCALVLGLRARVYGSTEGLADLADLSLQAVSLEEDDEHILLKLLASLGILDGIGNVGLSNEEITAGSTPQHAFKGGHFGAGDHTSNEPVMFVNNYDCG